MVGFKMIDLLSFNKSLKTIWIKKYLDKTNMGKWKLFFDLELGRYGGGGGGGGGSCVFG